MKITKDVLIIGGGLTGLALACELKRAGKSILVVEKNNRTGGVIRTHNENGFVREEGPNTGVLGSIETMDFLAKLAPPFELETASDASKIRFILKNGVWCALPSGILSAVRTPLFTAADKLRLLAEPLRRRGKNPDESLADFVKRRMGVSFLNYAIDPFVLGVYAGDPARLITRHAFAKLYQLEQTEGSLIGGSLKRAFRKSKIAKASRKVFTSRGGLSNMIKAMTDYIGSENIITGADIKNLIPSQNMWQAVIQSSSQLEVISRQAVCALPAYVLPSILNFLPAEVTSALADLNYARTIEVNIGFKKWQGRSLAGFGGLIGHIEKRDVLGILHMSTFLSNRAPVGGALLTTFIGGMRRAELCDLDDAEIEKLLAREITELTGLKEFKPDLLRISRYEKAIPQYGIESAARFAACEKVERDHPGLFIAGNLRGGIGMSDRITQAVLTARKMSV